MQTIGMVPEVAFDSATASADFDEAASTCSPLLLKGLARQWPAFTKWAGQSGLDYMRSVAGKSQIQVPVLSHSG